MLIKKILIHVKKVIVKADIVLNELKNLAITYYGLSEEEYKTKNYKKPDLCKYIKKIINQIKKKQNINNTDDK